MVVGVSTAVNALAWGVRSTFALFYVAMLGEFAWGRGPTALGYSLSWLGFVFFAPIAGWLSDRWGTRTVVAGGGVILGVALVLTGQVTSLTQYYLCFGILGAAGIAGMLIPSTTIVTRWFVRSRGTAMGVLSAGGPGSAVAFYPLNAALIAMLGWRTALVVFGCIIAAATVSLVLLYREPPVPADRAGADAGIGPTPTPRVAAEVWTLRRALRSVRLWAAFTMTALGVIGFQIMATHQVAHAVDRAVPRDTAVWLFAVAAACMMAGNLLGGWLSDRVGRGWVFVVGTVVAILGIACFALVGGPQDRVLLLLYALSGVASACGSRSSPRFPPTSSPDRTWVRSSAWSSRGAAWAAPSAPSSPAGSSMRPGAIGWRSWRPASRSRARPSRRGSRRGPWREPRPTEADRAGPPFSGCGVPAEMLHEGVMIRAGGAAG